MKGIVILAFNENAKVQIDTQFPSNLSEFLGLNSKLLSHLADLHLKNKEEPHLIETKLNDELKVVSFYSGFSFRHYVGKPNFTISIFLSEGDEISFDIEGMLRRLAHELLPKREALNFDDILGQYYEMLRNEELAPFWEEIVEGESSKVAIISKTPEEKKKNTLEPANLIFEGETQVKKPIEDTTEIRELQELLEEKMGKIRELSKKYTDLTTEKNSLSEKVKLLKDELSEQYLKLENWSKQMADLNENNAKLMEEVKTLNKKVKTQEESFKEKEIILQTLQKRLQGIEEVEKEAEKIFQEKEELLEAKKQLNSQVEQLKTKYEQIVEELERAKTQNSSHLDSITSLKLEIKKLKDERSDEFKEKDQIKEEIFDLKKEIKVLRRERDHYQKIVKDNKLL